MLWDMSEKSLTVVAKVKAKRGKEAEVLKELLSLVGPSRRDPGCINYDLHHSQDDPASFLFHENWASREQLEQHLAKPDLQAVLSRLGALVAEAPEITLWDKIA
jgi:quinol monooxygenase YgiN